MGMLRITTQKLLILFRLVIFVSLAAYALPSSSAAMHGGWSQSEIAQSGDHSDMASARIRTAIRTPLPKATRSPRSSKCCKDVVPGMAILAATDTIGRPRLSPVREFVDEAGTTGELPLLHPPPKRLNRMRPVR